MTAEDKLDRIAAQLTDLRVGVETMAGDLRAGLARLDSHDRRASDVEDRLRSLERWRWSLPSASLVLSILSVAAVAYGAFHR